jgi:hypothetical protein
MDCAQLADTAAELALEIVTGEERADALAHLDQCTACQELVGSLTAATDRLLVRFTPEAEPPEGFEERVLGALTEAVAPVTPLRARRRRPATAMALAACAALVVILLSIGPAARPSLAAADMRTAAGDLVGQVYLRRDTPTALFLTLPGWVDRVRQYGQPGASYAVRIDVADGTDRMLPVDPAGGSSWAMTLNVDPHAVRAVALVDSRGHVWCEARFS